MANPNDRRSHGRIAMIVKLQEPLFTMEDEPPVLAYDQSRKFMITVPLTKALNKLFGPKVKIYAEASVDKDGALVIENVVPDRSW